MSIQPLNPAFLILIVDTIEGDGDGPASRRALSRNCQDPPTSSFKFNCLIPYLLVIKLHSFSSLGNAVDSVLFRLGPSGILKNSHISGHR